MGRWILVPLICLLLVALALGGVGGVPTDRPDRRPGGQVWEPGVPVAIKVHQGEAKFRVPAGSAGAETLVIVSALSRAPGPFPIQVNARAATSAEPPEREVGPAPRPPRPNDFSPPPLKEPSRSLPPAERSFHLMVRDGDLSAPTNYLAVEGELRAVGKYVQVYVAKEDLDQVAPALLKDLVATFDDQIIPVAAAAVGLARDVDGDGRFTILISSWLNRLGNGRDAVDGFVRVTDLDPGFSPPFGNRCDMMYLGTRLRPGPYLRTIMAHEYMHAVVFSGKSRQFPGRPVGVEEEGWLDEAVAHLAEDVHGFSRSNIDYRVSAFLSRPARYQLVVEDYYRAGLFRSHGNRGSTYLFLRWCVDQYGPGLIPALIHSPLRGTANIEAATGQSFPELFRRWTVALFQDAHDSPTATAASEWGTFRSIDVRAPMDEWQLAGPRVVRMTAGGAGHRWTSAGTSCHYIAVAASSAGAVEVNVSGPADAAIQVTAIPLPAGTARLKLQARSWRGADGDLRVQAEIHETADRSVRLTALAWEPLVPSTEPQVPGFRRGQLDALGIAAHCGSSLVPGCGELQSRPIHLKDVHPRTGPLVLKLLGADSDGRRVAAWAEINQAPVSEDDDRLPLARQN